MSILHLAGSTVHFFCRMREACPELLSASIQSPLFAVPSGSSEENTPKGMAKNFGVPFLGSLSMDPNLLKACEDGVSFTETYPASSAATSLLGIVDSIIASSKMV
jgi:hypothetical protein